MLLAAGDVLPKIFLKIVETGFFIDSQFTVVALRLL
jgi:hypothetical protein